MFKRHTISKPYKIQYSVLLSTCFFLSTPVLSQDLSYNQAEQKALQESNTVQATQALQDASKLNAEAVKWLGAPNINLNATAYAYHLNTRVPLDSVKNNISQNLTQTITQQIDQLGGSLGVGTEALSQIGQNANQSIQQSVDQLIPNSTNITLERQNIRPSISVIMPLYTGGLIRSTQHIAELQSERSKINVTQQEDSQRFDLIKVYFNVQLQQQLNQIARFNLKTMQTHVDQAYALEKQGFISQGQRMLFEVARNNALRVLNSTTYQYQQSQYFLAQQLHEPEQKATTPLFINLMPIPAQFTSDHTALQQSHLLQKLQMDTDIAEQNIQLQRAAQKPSFYAFGEYALDRKDNWIVGIAARYNLFSGIDHKKQVQAATQQKNASEFASEQAKQELQNLLLTAKNQMQYTQKTHELLNQNIEAAKESLRIQTLSFKEGMGTATQVVDAENALNVIQAEKALNAYQYILALATYLHASGQVNQFKNYIYQNNTTYIGQ